MYKINHQFSYKTAVLYTVLLLLHISHSYIERHEGASFIINWYKTYNTYASLEVVGMILAAIILVIYLSKVNWASYAVAGYAILMFFDGLYHIWATITENKSFASSYGIILTSIGFAIIGPLLFLSLKKTERK